MFSCIVCNDLEIQGYELLGKVEKVWINNIPEKEQRGLY